MTNIFAWIGSRIQHNVLAEAQAHVDLVLETVRVFDRAMAAHARGSLAESAALCTEVHRREHDADEVRRRLLDDLSAGVLLPPDRGDLMSFVVSMDTIADYTNGAARLLEFLERPPTQEISEGLSLFAADNVQAVTKLKEATDCLNRRELERALRLCNEVEEIEERGDERKRELFSLVLGAALQPAVLLLVHDLLESIENTSDRAEDSADLLRLLAIKNR